MLTANFSSLQVPPTSYYSYFHSLCLHFGKGCEHKEDEGLLNSHTLHLSIDTIELVNAGGADPQYAPDISVWASSLPRPYSVASDEPRIYLHQMVPGAGPEIASTNVHARSGGNSPEDYSTKIHAAFGGDGAGEKPPLSKNNGVLRGTALDFIPENSPWEYRPPQSSLPHFPSLPPPDLLSLPNPSLSCSRDFASSFSSPSPTVTCTPSPTLCSPRESAQSFTPPPRGLPSFDRQRIMPWPCEGSGDDVLDMDSLKLLKQASVYDLLQSSQIPFISTVDMVKPCTFGVVLISFVSFFPTTPHVAAASLSPFANNYAQIPYTVTRQEVISFVGSDSQYLANHNGASPIHITMERSTGKTMECYIEFVSDEAAARFARRLNSAYDASTSPRMGQRYVEVSLSSQNTLLKAIFPLAKCIKWVNASPVMLDEIPEWSSGFDGFLTDEEVFCLGRHSDSPHRVRHSFLGFSAIQVH